MFLANYTLTFKWHDICDLAGNYSSFSSLQITKTIIGSFDFCIHFDLNDDCLSLSPSVCIIWWISL